jgi:hypothetical protein
VKKNMKLRLIIVLVIVLAVAGYAAYLCVHYFFYNEYRKYLPEYTFEEGNEFKELKDDSPNVEGMILAAENDYLKLYTNTTTTEIAIYDKRSGAITYSNPVNRSDDPIASGNNMVDLNSQFVLTYYDISMTEIKMYNYDYSVEKGQYEIERLKDGIRYTYLLGNMENPTGLIPLYITEERLQEKILSKLTDKEARSIRTSYVKSKDIDGFLELASGVKGSKVGLQKMNKLIEKAGYTQADYDEDAAAASGGEIPERTTFTIPLEYRLVEDRLEVTIPTSGIKETGSGRLSNISLLCYFGAGGSDEEGYIMVPNGSGSLINFNNGKKTERYNQYVYGMDETTQSFTKVEDTEKARLPVYGIKHADSAVFAEITSGEAMADIVANVSGNTNSYNNVYADFLIRGSEEVYMFGASGVSADLPTLEKDIYQMDLTVSFAFLNGEEADYSGMANYYRNQLIERGELTQKEEEEALPFYLDIVGGIQRQESFLGTPYTSVYAMTTFDEAGMIVDALSDKQIQNIRMNYLGWFNNGYYHDVASNIKVDRELGGKRDLKKLYSKMNDAGYRLYGDVAFQRVSYAAEGTFKYNYKMENAQYYAGYPIGLGMTNPVYLRQNGTGYMESMYNVLSPKFLVRYVDKFLGKIDKVALSGVSLRDMGDMLASDKKRSNIINRENTKYVVLGQLERLDQQIDNLMMNGGNSYSFKYAEDLINVPASHNPFYIVDEEIPFYQMVIHGSIDYTTGAINLSDSYDKQDILLRMLEFGTAPHFTLSYEESSDMKYTGMNYMYTTQYTTWLEDAAELYQSANKVLKHVVNSAITDHSILGNGVRKVTYDNGVTIYINYNGEDKDIEGVTIPSMGYVLEGVAE